MYAIAKNPESPLFWSPDGWYPEIELAKIHRNKSKARKAAQKVDSDAPLLIAFKRKTGEISFNPVGVEQRTIEFRVALTPEQVALAEHHFEKLRWAWNEALGMLFEFDAYMEWDKASKGYVPKCPLGTSQDGAVVPTLMRWIKIKDEWQAVYYCQLWNGKRPYGMSCPVAIDSSTSSDAAYWKEPRLAMPTFFSLCRLFSHKEKPELSSVPAQFILGMLKSLTEAWIKYKSGKGGEPQFKSKKKPITTLICNDGKAISVKKDDDGHLLVKIPRLGVVTITDPKRWGDATLKTMKLTRRASGFYLQLQGEFEPPVLRPKTTRCKLEFPRKQGVLYGDDRGKQVKGLDHGKERKRIEGLQKRLSRQEIGSNNWKKTKKKIARINEKIRISNRNHMHKQSTFLTRTYGTIELMPTKHTQVSKPAPVVKHVMPAEYGANGAERVSEINKHRQDLNTGHLVALIKQKSSTRGRTVICEEED